MVHGRQFVGVTVEPLFVGYYTVGTPYENEADSLRVSLDGLGLAHDITGIDNRGDWQKNTQAKSDVLLSFIDKYPNRKLVYVDVDAFVLKKPVLFWDLSCDIACTLFNNSELLSGTIFFQATAKVRWLFQRWQELNRQYPLALPDGRAAWDQRTLHMAIKEFAGQIDFRELPQAYTYIVELSQKKYPDVEPIILHTRGSMRHGKTMGRVR